MPDVTAPRLRRARLIAVLLLFWAAGSLAPAAAQTSEPYRVGGIKVEASGKTATAAKELAVARGLPLALRQLVQRLSRRGGSAGLPGITAREARDLLVGYEVEEEQFAGTDYRATLAYRFDRRRVGAWLRDHGIRVVDATSRPVLVLPVWRAARGLILWDEPNPWRAAWTRLDLGRDGLVPIVTGAGDLQDLQAVDGPQAAAGDAAALVAAARRYDAGSVVVAVATPTAGQVRIAVRRYLVPGGQVRPMATLTAGTDEAALTQAARQIVSALEAAWRQRNQVDDTRTATLRAVAPLEGLSYWTALRGRLGTVPLIRRYRVVQFGADRSILDIMYAGSSAQLRDAMAEAGLRLVPDPEQGPDRWIVTLVRPGGDDTSNPARPPANQPGERQP